MSKSMIAGLLVLAAFVIVLIMTSGKTEVNRFGIVRSFPTPYVLLASSGVGVVVGALLRK